MFDASLAACFSRFTMPEPIRAEDVIDLLLTEQILEPQEPITPEADLFALGLDSMALLPRAVEAGMAYVPGAAFYAQAPRANTLRLSFVTASPAQIAQGVEMLARVLGAAS